MLIDAEEIDSRAVSSHQDGSIAGTLPALLEDLSEAPSTSKDSASPVWNVEFYTLANELVPLQDISRRGPFVGHASTQDPKLSPSAKQQVSRIAIDPILEYSMEFPFGQPAKVFVSSNTATYLIHSVSRRYGPLWTSFYASVCFAGHVINILLNWDGPLLLLDQRTRLPLKFPLVVLVLKVSRLGRMHPETVFDLLRTHHGLIVELLRHQDVDGQIHSAFLAALKNQTAWTAGRKELQRILGKSTQDLSVQIQAPVLKKDEDNIYKASPSTESDDLRSQKAAPQTDLARSGTHSHSLDSEQLDCIQIAIAPENSAEEPKSVPIYDPEPPRILRIRLDSKAEAAGSNALKSCPVCRLSLSGTIDSAIVHLKGHEEQIFRGATLPTPHTERISSLRKCLSSASNAFFAPTDSLSSLPRLSLAPGQDLPTTRAELCSPWLEPKQALSPPRPTPVEKDTKPAPKAKLKARAEHLASQLKAQQATIASARLLYFEQGSAKKPKMVPNSPVSSSAPTGAASGPATPFKCWNCLVLLHGSNKKRCLNCKAILL